MPLLEHIVATLVTDAFVKTLVQQQSRIDCWGTLLQQFEPRTHSCLTPMTSGHIIATMTLDTIVALVIYFEQECSTSTVSLNCGCRRRNPLTSPPMFWRKHLWNISALQTGHISKFLALEDGCLLGFLAV
jgi:hypothetical protein